MLKLSIFDGSERVATITRVGENLLIFARSSREWNEMKRLVDSGYDIERSDPEFLRAVAQRAQSFDFNTELIDE